MRPAGRFLGSSAAGLVALAVLASAFTTLVVLVESGSPLVGLDRRVAAALNAALADDPALVAVLQAITVLGGSPTSWVALGTLTAVLLIRRRWRLAVHVAVTGLGALVLSPAVKELVGRLRPVVEMPLDSAPGPSFPSGHALGSTVTYGLVLLVFLPVLPRRARVPAIAAAGVLVLAIGFTRLALGVHFLSDVLAGWLLGLAWLAVTATAFSTWRHHLGLPRAAPTTGLAPDAAPALRPAPDAAAPPVPHPLRRTAGLLVTWVLLLGALLGLGQLVTLALAGTAVDRLDTAVVRWLADHRTPALTAVADAASRLGSTAVVVAATLIAAALALAVTRRWRPLLFLAVVMLGEVTLFLATATIIERPRPPVDHLGPTLPPTASFPSGHVAAALTLYGAVALLVATRTRAWWRRAVLAAAALATVAVALARLYHGVHYPTDVLGSLGLGLGWLVAARRLLPPGPLPDPAGPPR